MRKTYRRSDWLRIIVLAGATCYVLATVSRASPPMHASGGRPSQLPAQAQTTTPALAPTQSAARDSSTHDVTPKDSAAAPPVDTTGRNATPIMHAVPISGQGLPAFDHIISAAMRDRQVPGVALTICRDGHLLVARNYGWENSAAQQALTVDSLFSLAGVSDLITATAILKLVDQNKLKLDDSIYALLDKPVPLSGTTIDPRFSKITVRHLLLHTAGWNEKDQGDPMYMASKIAHRLHEKLPLQAASLVRYIVSQPLDSAPGAKVHHSNAGSFLARLVIEHVSKQPYETFVRNEVLKPLGIKSMHLEHAAPGYAMHEVRRYDSHGLELPGGHNGITAPHGNWLSTSVELSLFLSSFSTPGDSPVIQPQDLAVMLALPSAPLAPRKNGAHVGLGWDSVQSDEGNLTYRKSGAAAGVRAFVEHRPSGVTWTLLMNSDGTTAEPGSASKDLIDKLRETIDHTVEWPKQNLFPPAALADSVSRSESPRSQ